MRPHDAPAIRSHEAFAQVGRRPRALPPGFQEVEQARRGLAQQGAGISAAVAEHLRGRLVDEADTVPGVDHQDALAQMLDHVLGQLREIGQVDFLPSNQRLAFAQAVRNR